VISNVRFEIQITEFFGRGVRARRLRKRHRADPVQKF
jgi:hypothetical protein